MIQRPVQLVDGVRAEGVADLWAVEGDADDAVGAAFANMAVVGDVREVVYTRRIYRAPQLGFEGVVAGISHARHSIGRPLLAR